MWFLPAHHESDCAFFSTTFILVMFARTFIGIKFTYERRFLSARRSANCCSTGVVHVIEHDVSKVTTIGLAIYSLILHHDFNWIFTVIRIIRERVYRYLARVGDARFASVLHLRTHLFGAKPPWRYSDDEHRFRIQSSQLLRTY